MKSILLIIPYFGKWPVWFDAYLVSISKNPTINWLCPTDCELPKGYPKNLKFLPTSLFELNRKVNTIVEAKVPLTPRKLCDIKPAYGDIFKNEIKDYDFWGICDMDIIWGDIRKFITTDILSQYDIISSRKEAISGHFNLFKNSEKINVLYKNITNYKLMFEKQKLVVFDEQVLTNYLKQEKDSFNIYWPSILCNKERGRDSHQEYYLDKWQWQNGKMIDVTTSKELMYLHFINWKRTMKTCEVKYIDNPTQFYFSFNGIHYKQHSKIAHYFNSFKNIFNGYWVREKRRIRRLKFKSLKKRVKRKLNL
ncbi:DUF6625 family protein [uncultured Lutibacter sp.]|uniref:DUF6625 family protein n=1 Tax=uncultured Lutibacter sp. TaxID=437739 RepID=UPI002631D5C8|nr:DUF6625 family protein [uncultured Lutibacter sp.]